LLQIKQIIGEVEAFCILETETHTKPHKRVEYSVYFGAAARLSKQYRLGVFMYTRAFQ